MDEVVRMQKGSVPPFRLAMGVCFIGQELIIGAFDVNELEEFPTRVLGDWPRQSKLGRHRDTILGVQWKLRM